MVQYHLIRQPIHLILCLAAWVMFRYEILKTGIIPLGHLYFVALENVGRGSVGSKICSSEEIINVIFVTIISRKQFWLNATYAPLPV